MQRLQVSYEGSASSVPDARHAVERALAAWGLSELVLAGRAAGQRARGQRAPARPHRLHRHARGPARRRRPARRLRRLGRPAAVASLRRRGHHRPRPPPGRGPLPRLGRRPRRGRQDRLGRDRPRAARRVGRRRGPGRRRPRRSAPRLPRPRRRLRHGARRMSDGPGDDSSLDEGPVDVVMLQVPVQVWARAFEQSEALQREFALVAADPAGVPGTAARPDGHRPCAVRPAGVTAGGAAVRGRRRRAARAGPARLPGARRRRAGHDRARGASSTRPTRSAGTGSTC